MEVGIGKPNFGLIGNFAQIYKNNNQKTYFFVNGYFNYLAVNNTY